MQFSLDDFVTAPSWATLDRCRKADLMIIANFYDVSVSYGARKADVLAALSLGLVEKGVLSVIVGVAKQPVEADVAAVRPAAPEEAGVSSAGVEPRMGGDPPSGASLEGLRLTVRL